MRIFLCEAKGESIAYPKQGDTQLPETYLTNFMSLGEVVKTYNAILSATEQIYAVDMEIVKVRDAVAHGRLASLSESFPLTLYKFGKPSNKMVPIEYAEEFSQTWLKERCALIFAQIGKVRNCSKSRNYKFLK